MPLQTNIKSGRFLCGVAVLLGAMLFVCALAGTATNLAMDGPLLARQMRLSQDSAIHRLEQQTGTGIAQALADYLAGKQRTAQVLLPAADGQMAPAFAVHELAHLVDVRSLVDLGRVLKWLFAGLLAVLALIAAQGAQRVMRPCRCVAVGLGIGFLLLAGLVVWGWTDFSALFDAFHRLLFRNALWLMDPQRDLLLALLPQDVFVRYAQLAALRTLAVLALALILLWLIEMEWGKQHAGT